MQPKPRQKACIFVLCPCFPNLRWLLSLHCASCRCYLHSWPLAGVDRHVLPPQHMVLLAACFPLPARRSGWRIPPWASLGPQILHLRTLQLISRNHQRGSPSEVSHPPTWMKRHTLGEMSTGNLPVSENSTCKPPVHLSDGCVPFRCASEPCQWASLNISKAYVYWKWSATLVNGGGKKKNPSVVCTEGFQSGRYSLQLCHAVFIQELSSSSWMWAKTWTWIGRLNI